MVVKLECDICGREIPEAAEGEGEDTGRLKLGYGMWGEQPKDMRYDFDELCEFCFKKLNEAITDCIQKLKLRSGVTVS